MGTQLECENDFSTLSSVEVKDAKAFYLHTLHVFMVWY